MLKQSLSYDTLACQYKSRKLSQECPLPHQASPQWIPSLVGNSAGLKDRTPGFKIPGQPP